MTPDAVVKEAAKHPDWLLGRIKKVPSGVPDKRVCASIAVTLWYQLKIEKKKSGLDEHEKKKKKKPPFFFNLAKLILFFFFLFC